MDKEIRPWGYYQILGEDKRYKVKSIVVNPNSMLSYQTHQFRQEHWLVVEGSGEALINGTSQSLRPGSNLTIGAGVPHRLINNTSEPLVVIEIQTGSYFGEEDIIRLQDEYGR